MRERKFLDIRRATLFPRSTLVSNNVTHEFIHPPHYHLFQPYTDMGLGDSFSKVLGKLKHPVAKGRRKLERKESSSTAEKVDLASPVTRPEPHVVAGGKHDREGNGIGVEGTQNNLCPDIEVEVERSPSREENNVDGEKIDQVDPPTFTPSITHNGEPDGM